MDRHPLRRVAFGAIPEAGRRLGDPEAEARAGAILSEVEAEGERAVRRHAEALGEVEAGGRLLYGRTELEAALAGLARKDRAILEAAQGRIEAFALGQRASIHDLCLPVPGGRAGHRLLPVARAGCYVPGGLHPLPSSALMTVTAAKAAGVAEAWCAGPRPQAVTLAAAALAGASGFLGVGGAQAIGALAFGLDLPGEGLIPPCPVVVGPGGRYVAAAKRLLAGRIGTEAPAGPSELLIVADRTADPGFIAADLLAQAEHDPAALPALVCLDPDLADRVDLGLAVALAALPEPNRSVAATALEGGFCFLARNWAEARAAVERLAPEHLELLLEKPRDFAAPGLSAGALFLGPGSAEVLGDYGAGPNHCLPTGGAARFASGLSVFAFLRAQTWLDLDPAQPGLQGPRGLAAEAAGLARLEGLEGHARSALLRASGIADGGRGA